MSEFEPDTMQTDDKVKKEETGERTLGSIPTAGSTDDFADNMATLNLSGRKASAARTLEVGIAVPRSAKKTGGHVEYELLSEEKFQSRYGDKASPRDYPWLLRDQHGVTMTRPRAYYSVEIPRNSSGAQMTQLRQDNWSRIKEAGDFESKPYAAKGNNFKPLDPNDEAAQFETSAGTRLRKYEYKVPHLVGADLPEIELTVPRSDGEGDRILLLHKDNPRFLTEDGRQMTAAEMGQAYGEHNVRIADTDGRWDSIAVLNERGRYEADRRLAKTYGMDFAYNRHLPDLVVEAEATRQEDGRTVSDPAGNQLVSMKLVRDTAQHEKNQTLAQIAADVDEHPRLLKAGVRITEGTYVSPAMAAEKYPEIYQALAKEYNLPKGFEKISSAAGADQAWVQKSKDVFITATAAQRGLREGETVAGRYSDTRTFTPKTKIAPGDRPGSTKEVPGNSLKMLYATLRDRESITPGIGKQIGVEPRIGHYDQRAIDHVSKVVPQKMEDLAGYDSGSDTPQDPRKQMIANRGNKRAAGGISVGA
ncbi:hypothetical protein [Breoghania sp. JC706]|uniref:hypothetical protein n=1 Tax=Breoghania sp. JC706 TaxID=3117732 RepID=UPI0030098322